MPLPSSEYSSDTYTKLLLHGNGVDTSTIITDDGDTGHTVTANGDAQIDTAQSKFGGASILFDGTGDYLSIPDSIDWDFGTNDFTIDFWLRHPSTGASNEYIFTRSIAGAVDNFRSWIDTSNQFNFICGGATLTTSAFSNNAWHHIAITRSGTTLRLFLNGIIEDSQSNSYDVTDSTPFYIASYGAGSLPFNGWLDEIRISKAIARWTSNFAGFAYSQGYIIF